MRYWLIGFGATAVFPLLINLPAQEAGGQPGDAGPGYVVSVDVPRVVLHASVRDSHGMRVSGLTTDEVRVLENGVPQPVTYFQQEDVPVTVGLVVDHSGSMVPKIRQVTTAAETFAQVSNPGDRIFVVNFNENVSLGLPPGVPFTDHPAALVDAIEGFPTTGRTALYDAILKAIDHFSIVGDDREKVLIVISDGDDNASKRTEKDVFVAAGKSDAVVYAIGLMDDDDPHPNPRFLKKLAHATGGEAFFPFETQQVASICERIARDIRAQYTIAYAPTNSRRDGTYRTVAVEARAPHRGKLEVRTRTGYYATPPEGANGAHAQ